MTATSFFKTQGLFRPTSDAIIPETIARPIIVGSYGASNGQLVYTISNHSAYTSPTYHVEIRDTKEAFTGTATETFTTSSLTKTYTPAIGKYARVRVAIGGVFSAWSNLVTQSTKFALAAQAITVETNKNVQLLMDWSWQTLKSVTRYYQNNVLMTTTTRQPSGFGTGVLILKTGATPGITHKADVSLFFTFGGVDFPSTPTNVVTNTVTES